MSIKYKQDDAPISSWKHIQVELSQNHDFFHFQRDLAHFGFRSSVEKRDPDENMATAVPATREDSEFIYPDRVCPVSAGFNGKRVWTEVHKFLFDVKDFLDTCGCETVDLNVLAIRGDDGKLELDRIALVFGDQFSVGVGWSLLDGNVKHEPAILVHDGTVVLTKDAPSILKNIPIRHREQHRDYIVRRQAGCTQEQLRTERGYEENVLREHEFCDASCMGPRLLRFLSEAQVMYHSLAPLDKKGEDSTVAIRRRFYMGEQA